MNIKIRHGEISEVLAADMKVAGADPVIYYGMKIPMELELYKNDASMTAYTYEELAQFVSWQFAIDSDFTDTTVAAVLISSGFSLSGNTLSFDMLTNSTRFNTILNGAESAEATAELKGWKSGETLPGICMQWDVKLLAAVVAGTASPPAEDISEYMLTSAILALIAACEVRIAPVAVDFMTAQQNVAYTVPADKLFKPDFGRTMTKVLTGYGSGLKYKWLADATELMPETEATMDAVYEFNDDVLDPDQYFPAGTEIIFEVTQASGSTTHSGMVQIKGDLINA